MKIEKEILIIANENGFDWWEQTPDYIHGVEKITARMDISCGEIIYTNYEKWDTHKSWADLATNKSFLIAMAKAYFEYDTFVDEEDLKEAYEELKDKLVDDLIENNGKNFWTICKEFLC